MIRMKRRGGGVAVQTSDVTNIDFEYSRVRIFYLIFANEYISDLVIIIL